MTGATPSMGAVGESYRQLVTKQYSDPPFAVVASEKTGEADSRPQTETSPRQCWIQADTVQSYAPKGPPSDENNLGGLELTIWGEEQVELGPVGQWWENRQRELDCPRQESLDQGGAVSLTLS